MKQFFISAAVLLFLGTGLAAKGDLIIDPTYESSITSDPNAAVIEGAIQSAINNIEADIANPVTVNINFGEMSSGLGESSTYQYQISYSDYVSALENNQTLSSQDITALGSLGLIAPYTSNPTVNPVNGSTLIQTTGPLLRALGFDAQPGAGNPDSTISFNASLVYEGAGTPPAGEYSLESVVTHEMDEVLGIGGGGSQLNAVKGGETPANGAVGPLDLYRYSSKGVRSYSTAAGPDLYFSIDGGKTNLVYFNQNGGNDNSDFADWGNGIEGAQFGNSPSQVQDAYGTPGTDPTLGSNEALALDVVGWDLTAEGMQLESAPEPNSLGLLLVGALAIGIYGRSRRVKANALGCFRAK